MGIFYSLFGGPETKEKPFNDLWKKINKMPSDKLVDAIKAKPNSLYCYMAFASLYIRYQTEAEYLLNEDGCAIKGGLREFSTSPIMLMGEGPELMQIRNALKAMLGE